MQLHFIARLGLMDILVGPGATILGWLTSLLYEFFGNFGLAIIFLTIIVRGLLVPLNVRSAKAMMKQQALNDKQAEIFTSGISLAACSVKPNPATCG